MLLFYNYARGLMVFYVGRGRILITWFVISVLAFYSTIKNRDRSKIIYDHLNTF
jgi:hypothetical protein